MAAPVATSTQLEVLIAQKKRKLTFSMMAQEWLPNAVAARFIVASGAGVLMSLTSGEHPRMEANLNHQLAAMMAEAGPRAEAMLAAPHPADQPRAAEMDVPAVYANAYSKLNILAARCRLACCISRRRREFASTGPFWC
jgi:hypothetical protein